MSTINQLSNVGSSINGSTSLEVQLSGATTTGRCTVTELANVISAILGISGDTIAPTVVSATVPSGAANTIVVVFSESVTLTTAGWSFTLNGSNWPISSASGSGTTWTFTMGSSATAGQTVLRSYVQTTGNTVDLSGNELGNFTGASVTNSVGDTTAPTVVSAVVEDADPDTVVITFSESVSGVTAAGWSFKKNGSAWGISSVTGSGTVWNFNMSSSAINTDTLLRSYSQSTGATVDGAGNELGNFTDAAVTNNVGSAFVHESQFTAANGTAITSYTPDLGNTWSEMFGSDSEIQGNAWSPITAGGNGYTAILTTVAPQNYTMRMQYTRSNTSNQLIFGMRRVDDNFFIAGNVFLNQVQIAYSAGAGTFPVGQQTWNPTVVSLNDTNPHILEFVVSGTTVTVISDGETLGTLTGISASVNGSGIYVGTQGTTATINYVTVE